MALADSDVLAPRVLPAPLAVAVVTYAGAPVAADTVLPLRPTGRNEPFLLRIDHPAGSAWLEADPLNRITLSAGPLPAR